MFEEYKKAVRDYYFSQKAAHQLPSSMEQLGRLKLKNQCLKNFSTKRDQQDVAIIKAFFNPDGKFETEIRSIEKVQLDRFRPLIKYINTGTAIREDEAVKLFAWLIGFQPYQDWQMGDEIQTQQTNPSSRSKNEEAKVVEKTNLEDALEDTSQEDTPNPNQLQQSATKDETLTPLSQDTTTPCDIKAPIENPEKKIRFKTKAAKLYYPIAAVLTLALTALIPFLIDQQNPEAQPQEKCMYWNGTKYMPTNCKNAKPIQRIIPMNINRYKNLQKIGWSDTLTKKSIGKIWYAKTAGTYEYFTDSGSHPMDSAKKLKPLSAYILSNHVSIYRFILTLAGGIMIAIFSLYLLLVAKKRFL